MRAGASPLAALATANAMTLVPARAELASVAGVDAIRPKLNALRASITIPVLVPRHIDVRTLYGVPVRVTVAAGGDGGYSIDLTDPYAASERFNGTDSIATLTGTRTPPGRFVDASGARLGAPIGANVTLLGGAKALYDDNGACGDHCTPVSTLTFRRGAAYYTISMPAGTHPKAQLIAFEHGLVVIPSR